MLITLWDKLLFLAFFGWSIPWTFYHAWISDSGTLLVAGILLSGLAARIVWLYMIARRSRPARKPDPIESDRP